MRSFQKTLVSFLLSAAMLMTAAVPAVLAAEGDAAAALNGAGDIVEVQAVLEQYGDELDLDLETLSKISKKDAVYQAMLDAEFATDADVQNTFAQALGEQALTIKSRAIADLSLDYNFNPYNLEDLEDYDNRKEYFITKYQVGSNVNTTSHHMIQIRYNQKQYDYDHPDIPWYHGSIDADLEVKEIPADWSDGKDGSPMTEAAAFRDYYFLPENSTLIYERYHVTAKNAAWWYVDLTDYLMIEGVFNRNPDDRISLRIIDADWQPYMYQQGDQISDWAPYMSYTYDLGLILDEFNAADASAMDELIQREGSVAGIDVTAYSALQEEDKAAVWEAIAGRNFATAKELAQAANEVIDSSLNLIAMLKSAEDADVFKEMIINGNESFGFGINLEDMEIISRQDVVYADMLAAVKNDTYQTIEELAQGFAKRIAQEISAPVRAIAKEDYAWTWSNDDNADINADNNWHVFLYSKFHTGEEFYPDSSHLARVIYHQRQVDRSHIDNGGNMEGKVIDIVEAKTDWTDGYDGSKEGGHTPQSEMRGLSDYNDSDHNIKIGVPIYCEQGEWWSEDISDYFIQDGQFIKENGEDFAIRIGMAEGGHESFYDQGERQMDYAPYLTFEYDLGGILDEINNAAAETIGQTILDEGAVIGIQVEAYKNLSYKAEVEQALLNKNFTSVEEAKEAANSMINRLVYTETVPMTAEGGQWGTIDLKTGAKTQGADPWLFVPGWAQRYNQAYFTFDQTATYGKEHIVGAQANLRRGYEESARDGVARYLLLYDDTETRNAIGFSNDTKQQGDIIRADVTELVKNNDTFTIYAAGAVDGVTAGGSALTTPKDEGLKDNAMFLTISYDKLAFANEVGKASNAEAAQSLVENYRTILGIPEDADTMAYAVAMMGTEFTSAAQLESVFERAALREVMIADVMPQPGQISRGSVTIRNLTAEVKDIQVVVAGYNENGQMVDSVFLTLANPQLNGYTSVSGLYRMSADNIVEIKAFLWDSLESLQPLDMPGVYRQQ